MTIAIARRRLLMLPVAGLALTACVAERPSSTTNIDPDSATIGISMPTRYLERWSRDGDNIERLLTELGYESSMQYGDDKPDVQFSQIQNMINGGVDVLVIAPIDGTMLGPVIDAAASNGIPVISYDRLIEGTEGVDYYVSFDNRVVGRMQGEFIVEKLSPDPAAPQNVELFGGSPDDPNAADFFGGAWEVLEEHFASGAFTSLSGKVPASAEDWQQIGILAWDSAEAQSEMQNRLNAFYTGGEELAAVLSPNDSLALGISQALDARGFTPGTNWPIVTGQDADKANVQNILSGKQAMTVFKDVRQLGERAATMVDQIVTGAQVEVNEGKEFDNGATQVPAFLLDPIVVTADNVEEILVGSEFYTAEELGL